MRRMPRKIADCKVKIMTDNEILRAARKKQISIIEREGDPYGIVASDEYYKQLVQEQREQAQAREKYRGVLVDSHTAKSPQRGLQVARRRNVSA